LRRGAEVHEAGDRALAIAELDLVAPCHRLLRPEIDLRERREVGGRCERVRCLLARRIAAKAADVRMIGRATASAAGVPPWTKSARSACQSIRTVATAAGFVAFVAVGGAAESVDMAAGAAEMDAVSSQCLSAALPGTASRVTVPLADSLAARVSVGGSHRITAHISDTATTKRQGKMCDETRRFSTRESRGKASPRVRVPVTP
jgi:hypothetical protein